MSSYISIDFGTSSSAVAIIKGRKAHLVPPKDVDVAGARIFPTTAFIDNQEGIYVCGQAEIRKNMDMSRYIKEFKLDMKEGNHPYLPTSYRAIVAKIIETLKDSAEYCSSVEDIDRIVITIPAIYDTIGDPRRGIMLSAAKDAGFKRVEFLNESEAAAIYFNYLSDGSRDGVTLVYDLGGGTFDPSLVEHRDGEYALLGNGEGVDVGGKFFTEKIIEQYKEHINYQEPDDLAQLIKDSNRIVDLCEMLKRQLSTAESTTSPDNFTISRSEFESYISSDVGRTLEACDKLIKSSGREWADIDNILLIGGSCDIPFVRNSIVGYAQTQGSKAKLIWRDYFRDDNRFDPQFAVVLGGVLYARSLFAPKPSIGYIQFCECGEYRNAQLKEGATIIGRYSEGASVDIPIKANCREDMKMSRRHCQIEAYYVEQHNLYTYILSDLDSANGTYLNGERIERGGKLNLKSGDKIKIGNHIIEINC